MKQHTLQKTHARRRFVLALFGAAIGIAAFLCIHTGASLLVTQDAWILDGYIEKDILQHYTGWLFYRDAPLTFPLGMSGAMQYPAGTAVTFTDSVPLFAIFFRLFGAWLPATFQYFGLFTLACYALLGAAAALLLCLFLADNFYGNACTLLGTGLFVTYPILIERSFRHTALAAQCFILFALYLYFLDKKEGYRPRGAWFALTALSAAVHPYFVPMVYAVLLASLLEHVGAVLVAARDADAAGHAPDDAAINAPAATSTAAATTTTGAATVPIANAASDAIAMNIIGATDLPAAANAPNTAGTMTTTGAATMPVVNAASDAIAINSTGATDLPAAANVPNTAGTAAKAKKIPQPRKWQTAALHAGAFLLANGVATLAVLYSISAFASPASDGISGYSYFCMNLNSLYNPVSRGGAGALIWSRILPAFEQGLGTYDGFNYMGLGVLAFGAVGLVLWAARAFLRGVQSAQLYTPPHRFAAVRRGMRGLWLQCATLLRRHWALLLVCVVLCVFAVSNVLVLNGTVLFSLPIPGFVSRLGNTFRSSGRMFWPVSYLALLCCVVFWARRGGAAASATNECAAEGASTPHTGANTAKTRTHRHRIKRAAGVLCVTLLLALQLWDTAPALAVKRAAFAQPTAEFTTPMQSAAWTALAGQYTHLFSLDDTLTQALYPALWAAQNGMTTNDGFTARFDFAAHSKDVQAETQRLLAGEVQPDTLYLTCDYARFAKIANALLAANANVTCAWLDGIWYAIIPNRAGLSLPAAGDGYYVYPSFPLQIAPLTDALWTGGVLNSDKRTCIFYAGQAADAAFADAQQVLCEGAAYDVLHIDTSDPGWVMVTLDIPDAFVLTDKNLTAR